MKRVVLFSAFFAFSISIFFTVSPSFAASEYDNVIKVTDTLIRKGLPGNSSCSSDVDISNSYPSLFKLAVDSEPYPNRKSDFLHQYDVFKSILDNPASGYWAVIQMSSPNHFRILFALKEDYHTNYFQTSAVQLNAKPGKRMYSVILFFKSCTPFLSFTSRSGESGYAYSHWQTVHANDKWYLNTFPIKYPDGYEGVKLANYIPPIKPPFDDYQPPQFKSCDAVDIACHLSNLFAFLNGFFSGLLKLLTYLFVPDFSRISGYFNSALSSVVQSLGFLTYPFEFSSKLFNAVSDSFKYSNFCAWSSQAGYLVTSMPDLDSGTSFTLLGGSFFGKEFYPIRQLCYVESNFPLLIKVARSFAQILIAIATISLIRRRFIQLTGGIS